MNKAGMKVMEEFKDIILGFGESDEYSFLLKKESGLFGRRIDKIVTNIVSCFSSAYCMLFPLIMQ